jgi:hypothetical protein
MDINARMRAHSLIGQLTCQGGRFSSSIAQELIALVPTNKRKLDIGLSMAHSNSSSDVQYATSGGGSFRAQRDDDVRRWELGEAVTWRCGNMKIDHRLGVMTIYQMFDGTHDDETGTACRLIYHPGSKRPLALKLLRQRGFSLLRFSFSISTFEPWKLPNGI